MAEEGGGPGRVGGAGAGRAEAALCQETAEGLWARLRDVVLAAQRLEAFEFGDARGGTPPREDSLDELLRDGSRVTETARELVLRALRVAADAVNYRILLALGAGEAVELAELARLTGLPRLAVSERVNELVQAGLAARVLERDAVAVSPAARAWLGVVDAIERRLAAAMRERLPGLVARGG